MNKLSLSRCLSINKPSVTAFYGGGGKTSLIYTLAGELSSQGKKVLITTTTKIFPYTDLKTVFIEDNRVDEKNIDLHFKEGKPIVTGQRLLNDGKIEGFNIKTIANLKASNNYYILVEADGAKGKSMKGHAEYEPVLPDCADLIIPVVGADIIGASIAEKNLHRVNIFRKTICRGYGTEFVDEQLTACAYAYMIKLGSVMAPRARIKAVLNKSDLLPTPLTAANIATFMFNEHKIPELLVTAARDNYPVHLYFKKNSLNRLVKISAVILAAGKSERMGRDKLLMPYCNHTILGETVKQLLATDIDEIILVTKPGEQWRSFADSNRIKIAVNHRYQLGQASSLITGLNAVDYCSQGVLFVLGDQPAITTPVYNLLLNTYIKNFNKVTMPVYNGKRGNPVLFDRSLWPELIKLEGDYGGRNVIKGLSTENLDFVECKDQAVILDIDTPEDYDNLTNKAINNKGTYSSH